MRSGKYIAGLGVVALGFSMALAAPTTRPAAEIKEGNAKTTIRLFSPWSKMTSLSDDQRMKISDLHKKALADIKAIEMKQEDDIKALLSEDQKKELRELQEKESADRKSRSTASKRGSKTGDESAAMEEKKDEGGEK